MSGRDWKQMFKGSQEDDYELVKYHLNTGIDPYKVNDFKNLKCRMGIKLLYTTLFVVKD